MKKHMNGELDFNYKQSSYFIDWHGTWLLDGPVGYEMWLEEYLNWTCYDSNDNEVENNKVLIEAEKQLQITIASAIV